MNFGDKTIQRVVQESVPGKQITIAHVIASPMKDIYKQLEIEEEGAIGILNITPYETAIIAGDIVTKSADVKIRFADRFTGSLIITGDVEAVETAIETVNNTFKNLLGFTVTNITKT